MMPRPTQIPEATPLELSQELGSGSPPRLLDVREPFELDIARIGNETTIPLGELEARLGELDASLNWVVVCRSGARSGNATQFLLQNGFKNVRNLRGGILAWGREVDPSIRPY